MKKLWLVVIIVCVLLAGLFVAKDFLLKTIISTGVKAVTGVSMEIKSMHVGLLKTVVGIKGLKLYNPSQFQDKVMLDMPEIYIEYDLGAILKKNIHLPMVRIDMKELMIIKNEKGEMNLDSLKPPAAQEKKDTKKDSEKKAKAPAPSFRIDVLELKIGKVVQKDYSKGDKPAIQEFNLNLDGRYENINNPQELVSVIVFKTLMKTPASLLKAVDPRRFLGSSEPGAGLADKVKSLLNLGK